MSACSRTPRHGCARSTPTRFGRPVSGPTRQARRSCTSGLHPATPALYLSAGDSGSVRAIAETVSGGPGYHRFVGRVLERLGQELAIAWDEATAGITFAERPDVERAYLGWLGPTLAAVRNARQRSSAGVQVGTPPGTRYTFEGAIATSLGPRDDAWLESAVADPRVAIEITPWWLDATDGRYLLNRALALMWLEVRWRKPAVEGEAERLEDVHRLLSKSFPLEPGLPYPWHAWAELISFGGFEDGMTRQVHSRSKLEPPEAPIGYRRDPVSISHEGWALEIPGEFAERRTEEEWWGGGAGRSVTLAATDTGSMAAQAFLAQVAGDLGARGAHTPGRAGRGPGSDQQRRVVRRGGGRARRLLGGQRLGRRDPHRLRRPERLAVGPGHVEVAGPGLIGRASR